MEYVVGRTLDRIIPRGGMPLAEVLRLAVPIADALSKAHAAGIIHRDLEIALAPGELNDELTAAGTIPSSPPEIPLGLPSDLLRRRPDVRQAERNLSAASTEIAVNVASLFPSLSLTAQYGSQTGSLLNLVNTRISRRTNAGGTRK